MNFSLKKDQNVIRCAVEEICSPSDNVYCAQKNKVDVFPEFFYSTLALDGWLGLAMPLEYGGTGLGCAALRHAPKCAVFRACEATAPRTATIVPPLIPPLNAEKALGLPKFY